jgi:hypothetical protein
MNTRFVGLLAAVLACTASEVQGQSGSLTAFRSERELTRFLRSIEPPPPPPPLPLRPSSVAPLPAGSFEGPVDTWPAVLTGRVVNAQGQPEPAVLVRIESLNVGASTGADGSYRLVVPRARFQPGQGVTINAIRTGLNPASRTIKLQPGMQLTYDFRMAAALLLLEDVVVTGTAGAADAVTNNQHEGVDEGGIVKVYGDYLVTLRRGRLFTVDIGGGRLRPVDAVNAFGPDMDPDGTWYDELLVSDGKVVVIGFSYERGGTEIGLFDIDRQGRLRHRSTYHMRSDDYYSSRNYASRLAEGKLILYAPVPAGSSRDVASWMPAMRRWHRGAKDDEFRRTLRPTRVYRADRAMERGGDVMLHTVTTCELGRGELDCESSAVAGPAGRVFYVSPTAVYVWASEWMRRGERPAASMLYRMPLDGAAPTALGVEGVPTDQFSFMEGDDGHLNVLVRAQGPGEAMWAARWVDGDVRLLRVPLSRFGDGRREAPQTAYRILPRPAERNGEFHNRFVGSHVLYGMGTGWGSPKNHGSRLYVAGWWGGAPAHLPLPHGVDRIEVMGGDAVVVGADEEDLHFSGIRLEGAPRVAQRYVQRQASQGELRSHGFFYRADGVDEGVLGLPLRGPGKPGYEHLFQESASILFLRNTDAQFRALGRLEAREENEADDGCVASCVDWYGNARPIFLRGRTFALLGYELVEGAMADGRMRELRRVSFAPRAVQARR